MWCCGGGDVNENDIMKELLEEKVDASEAIENLIKEDVEIWVVATALVPITFFPIIS